MKAASTSTHTACKQLQIALILWREDIATREEAPEFFQQHYRAMDGMFSRVLGVLDGV